MRMIDDDDDDDDEYYDDDEQDDDDDDGDDDFLSEVKAPALSSSLYSTALGRPGGAVGGCSPQGESQNKRTGLTQDQMRPVHASLRTLSKTTLALHNNNDCIKPTGGSYKFQK